MKPEQENFDQLRRLLKLKRYEQPPPRYFNDFSSRIVARISAGERGGRESALDMVPWLQKLWEMLEAKPILPAVFGAAICVLLVFGVGYTEKTVDGPPWALGAGIENMSGPPGTDSGFALKQDHLNAPTMLASSTNPVIQLGNSLFDQIRGQVMPASLRFGN